MGEFLAFKSQSRTCSPDMCRIAGFSRTEIGFVRLIEILPGRRPGRFGSTGEGAYAEYGRGAGADDAHAGVSMRCIEPRTQDDS
jgi:hypothetical protein